jgi:hypothetical protein
MKKYLISIGAISLDNFDSEAVHTILVDISKDWWRYLPFTWIVTTDKSAKEIADRIKPFAKFVFIIKVNLKDISGYLPKDAWDWIEKNRKKV